MSPRIDIPDRRVLGVFDDELAEARALAALRTAGVADGDVDRLAGTAAAAAFDPTGRSLLVRLRRIVQFSLMDQMPALAWYEAALRDGRSVLSVRVGRGGGDPRPGADAVADAMRGAGGHFVNGFGRFSTREYVRWRGAEPPLPDFLR